MTLAWLVAMTLVVIAGFVVVLLWVGGMTNP